MSVDAAPEAIAAFRGSWGLDEPVWQQYLRSFGAIAHGDLGQSMRDRLPAIRHVANRIPATLVLTLPALALKLALGIGPANELFEFWVIFHGSRPQLYIMYGVKSPQSLYGKALNGPLRTVNGSAVGVR